MIKPELLKILCCPETHQPLAPAEASLVEKLNQQIALGELQNRVGQNLSAPIEGGLLRSDGRRLYPIRGNLPILLVDEAIEMTAGVTAVSK
jgi:uncharacterized protein YbaR (Trm112 family)